MALQKGFITREDISQSEKYISERLSKEADVSENRSESQIQYFLERGTLSQEQVQGLTQEIKEPVSAAPDGVIRAEDAFLKSFRAMKDFDTSRPFFPWFYRILKNACLSFLKRKKLVRKFSLSAKEEDESDIDLEDQTYDPQVIVDKSEVSEKIWEAFNKLNLKNREIIMMRHFQDRSQSSFPAS